MDKKNKKIIKNKIKKTHIKKKRLVVICFTTLSV